MEYRILELLYDLIVTNKNNKYAIKANEQNQIQKDKNSY